jgi:hypothetical protein
MCRMIDSLACFGVAVNVGIEARLMRCDRVDPGAAVVAVSEARGSRVDDYQAKCIAL